MEKKNDNIFIIRYDVIFGNVKNTGILKKYYKKFSEALKRCKKESDNVSQAFSNCMYRYEIKYEYNEIQVISGTTIYKWKILELKEITDE